MKNLPSHLNKFNRRLSRSDRFQDFDDEYEAETAASNLLRKKMDLTPINFELEEENLENSRQIAEERLDKKQEIELAKEMKEIRRKFMMRKPESPIKVAMKKKKTKGAPAKKVVRKNSKLSRPKSQDQDLSLLKKRIAEVKKDLKSKVDSLLENKMKRENYREKGDTPRPPRELKKIAKRAQTKAVESRFAPKEIEGKVKRVLVSKNLSKEQILKKRTKRAIKRRNPPSFH